MSEGNIGTQGDQMHGKYVQCLRSVMQQDGGQLLLLSHMKVMAASCPELQVLHVMQFGLHTCSTGAVCCVTRP